MLQVESPDEMWVILIKRVGGWISWEGADRPQAGFGAET